MEQPETLQGGTNENIASGDLSVMHSFFLMLLI
jgi:hypothetical protein